MQLHAEDKVIFLFTIPRLGFESKIGKFTTETLLEKRRRGRVGLNPPLMQETYNIAIKTELRFKCCSMIDKSDLPGKPM